MLKKQQLEDARRSLRRAHRRLERPSPQPGRTNPGSDGASALGGLANLVLSHPGASLAIVFGAASVFGPLRAARWGLRGASMATLAMRVLDEHTSEKRGKASHETPPRPRPVHVRPPLNGRPVSPGPATRA